MTGILYGVSVGPGDPEMMTLQAVRIIRQADVIAAPCSGGAEPVALTIAAGAVPEIANKPFLRLDMPMTRNSETLTRAHREAARQVAKRLAQGLDVAFLTLGDVSVYSTYGYLQKEVKAQGFETRMVAGVTSFCAAAALSEQPLVEAEQPLVIIPGSYPDMPAQLEAAGTKVIMKTGKSLEALKKRLRETGQYERAVLVERCGMRGQRFYRSLDEVEGEPYLSLVIIRP